jgi:hypothetical protein
MPHDSIYGMVQNQSLVGIGGPEIIFIVVVFFGFIFFKRLLR